MATLCVAVLAVQTAGADTSGSGGAGTVASPSTSTSSSPTTSPSPSGTPVWKLHKYVSRGFDRSFKCDEIEDHAKPPQVVVYGGSRALRMDPTTIRHKTGLRAFNAAFHNGRPEDAWAFTDFLMDRSPDTTPCVIWCLQATNLADVQLAPGLIVDKRLSQAFPKKLIDSKMAWAMKQPKHNLLGGRRYNAYGMLLWNTYDRRRAAGQTVYQSITNYLSPKMLALAGNHKIPHRTRAMQYFRATIKKLNKGGVKPLIVIMPYHPRVVKAFMAVGWGYKERWFKRYLSWLQKHTSLKFRVLNCLNISTFRGSPYGFYDGSHLTRSNSQALIRYCVKKAPGCFRIHKSWIPSTSAPTVSAPTYRPVPESTIPGDQLE